MQRLFILVLLFVVFLLGACKKDMLYFQSVQKINSYTDTDRLNKILFIDSSNGFIAGGERFADAVILATHDGGYTWQKMSFPVAGKGLYDMVVSPSGAICACGFDGKFLRSYDQGNTWLFTQMYYFAFSGMAFTDAAHAIAVGGVSFNEGTLQYMDSSGKVTSSDSLGYELNKITMTSNSTGYICGYGAMQKTTDGGKTWAFQNVQGDNFMAMDIHGDEIWMCGYNGGIYYTSDGGNNWTRYRNGNDVILPRYRLLCILFTDDNSGWAAGEGGKVIHSTDGGRHWAEYKQFTTNAIRSIARRPNGDLLMAGDAGALYRLTP